MMNTVNKSLVGAVVALAVAFGVNAQSVQWLRHYGSGTLFTGSNGLAHDGNGGAYLIGQAPENGLDYGGQFASVSGRSDALLVRLDADGNSLWARTGGGICSNVDLEVAQQVMRSENSGGPIIAGVYMTAAQFGSHALPAGSCLGEMEAFMASYSSDGDCLWATSINGTVVRPHKLLERGQDLFLHGVASEGPVFFAASPGTSLPAGAFLARYAMDGSLMDVMRTVLNGEVYDAEWFGNDQVLCGSVAGTDSLFQAQLIARSPVMDGFVCVSNSQGDITWFDQLGSDSLAVVMHCEVTTAGTIVVGGLFYENLFLGGDTLTGADDRITLFTACYSGTGELLWAVPVHTSNFLNLLDMELSGSDEIILTGNFVEDLSVGSYVLHAVTSRSVYILKLDEDGEAMAALAFARTQFTSPGGLLAVDDGVLFTCNYDSTFTLAGWSVPATQVGLPDIAIIKFDSLSGFSSVQPIDEGGEELLILSNPNDGLFRVRLPARISDGSNISLSISDGLGRLVHRGSLVASSGAMGMDLRGVATGTYHVELEADGMRYHGKMVVE